MELYFQQNVLVTSQRKKSVGAIVWIRLARQ